VVNLSISHTAWDIDAVHSVHAMPSANIPCSVGFTLRHGTINAFTTELSATASSASP
jgi:hypothetical protein